MEESVFKRWSASLWSLGLTLLSLIVVRLAVDQYPEYFHESIWLLPVSSICVVLCWVVPLLAHERTKSLFQQVVIIPYVGTALGVVLLVGIPTIGAYGTYRLFRFHINHVRILLSKEHNVGQEPRADSPKAAPTHSPLPSISPKVKTPRIRPGSDPFIEFQDDQFLSWGGPLVEGLRKASLDWQTDSSKERADWKEARKESPQDIERLDSDHEAFLIKNNIKLRLVYINSCENLMLFRKELVRRVPGGDSGRGSILEATYSEFTSTSSRQTTNVEIEEILKDFDELTARLSAKPSQ